LYIISILEIIRSWFCFCTWQSKIDKKW